MARCKAEALRDQVDRLEQNNMSDNLAELKAMHTKQERSCESFEDEIENANGEESRRANQRKFTSIHCLLDVLCFKTLACIGHASRAVAAAKESLVEIKQRME